jgi:hypothetical protein
MAIADESLTRMIEAQASQGQDPEDAKLWVKFFLHPVKNEAKSSEAGRPIFEEIEFITIMVPGDKDNIVERAVWEHDRARFSKQYTHWKATGQEAVTGTPLEAWPVVTRAQVEELKHFGVRTVEDLSNLSDANTAKFMGVQALKQKAKAFLEAASGNGGAKFQAAIEQKDEQIASLEKMVRDQSEKIEQLLKAKR